VEGAGENKHEGEKKGEQEIFLEAIGNIMLRFRLLHKQIRFN